MREVAASLGIAESCLHRWKQQNLIDRGLKTRSPEQIESAALAVARARIAELKTEVRILRKAAEAFEEVVSPKARFALVAEMAAEGVPVKQALRGANPQANTREARFRTPQGSHRPSRWTECRV